MEQLESPKRQAEAISEKGESGLLPSYRILLRAANVDAAVIRVVQLQLSLDTEQQAAKQALANGQKVCLAVLPPAASLFSPCTYAHIPRSS